MRTPHAIAAEAKSLQDTSTAAAVPINREQLAQLVVEFMTALVAIVPLEAAEAAVKSAPEA